MEKLTDRNQHTQTLILLATYLKSKKHQTVLEAIKDINNAEGSLPSEISKYRDSVYKELTVLAKKV